MQPIYFAHPINVYGTDLEYELMHWIVSYFSKTNKSFGLPTIENPAQTHHQKGYELYAKFHEDTDDGKSGMDYFFDEILPFCSGAVCLTFLDGMWGLGVASEAKWFIDRGKPVWTISPKGVVKSFNNLEQANQIVNLDPKLVLSRQVTRERTWGLGEPYKTKIPFEEGHLVHQNASRNS